MSLRERLLFWWEGIRVRRMIKRGQIGRVYDACVQCIRPIQADDEAMVCTECGGRNTPIQENPS